MSEKLQWFQFYATDWISDETVRLMDGRQRGWYIDLLAHDWQEGGIPDDVDGCKHLTSFWTDYAQLEALIGGGPDDNQLSMLHTKFSKILTFFKREGYHRRSHPRLQTQRSAIQAKSLRQSEGARLTNAKRNAKRGANYNGKRALSDAVSGSVSATEPEPEPENTVLSSSEISTTVENHNTQAAAPSALLPADPLVIQGDLARILETFRTFGRGCTGRDLKTCQRLWERLTGTDREAVWVDIQASIPLWRGRPTEKIPQPWNYLEGRYWERNVNRKQPEQEMGKFERGFRKAAAEFIRETSAGGNKP